MGASSTVAQQVIPRNVTLDDTDPRVFYSGGWIDTQPTVLNFGGSHRLGNNPGSTARISFVGNAVYFLSSLWPYHVTTQISLDNGPRIIVDLQDYNYRGPGQFMESAEWRVIYSWTGLTHGIHTLEVSVAPGEQFAVFDGIIYTELETVSIPPTPDITSPPNPPPSDPTLPSLPDSDPTSILPDSQDTPKPPRASTTPAPGAPVQSSSRTVFIIGGVLGGCAFCFIGYCLYRCGRQDGKRRKRLSNPPVSIDPSPSRRRFRDTFMSTFTTATDVEAAQPAIASKGVFQPASLVWYHSIAPRLSRTFSRRRPSHADTRDLSGHVSAHGAAQRTHGNRRRDQESNVPPVPPLPSLNRVHFPQYSEPHSGRYPALHPTVPSPPEVRAVRSSVQPILPTKVMPTKIHLAHTRSYSAQSIKTTNYDEEELYGGIAESMKSGSGSALSSVPTRTRTKRSTKKATLGHHANASYGKSTYGETEKGGYPVVELSWGSPPPPAYILHNN
ncbi:hypothetical protein CVT24_002245 [Panaeolus cyanescens]|uniref:Uncharacterized protein n=1 Tax=Panaeolus cyanescens TaxID=181874 RepID=A0A409YIB7_9AGAR|nr:hypothetical protein CVT24_002245 [Panaeolus cyanescens]